MDYAEAVNAEIKDLFAAGADVVQIDEPYMQARPEKARQYGLKALNRALDGVQGTTAVHICFGYAAIIHERPSGYSFLPELARCSCRQVSIETAQSHLDCSALQALAGKQIMVGCIDLSDPRSRRRRRSSQRIERALPHVKARERDPGARLRHEVPAARAGHRQAARDGRGGEDPAREHGEHEPGSRSCSTPSTCSTAPGGRAAPRGPAGAQGLPRGGRRSDRLRRPAARRRWRR